MMRRFFIGATIVFFLVSCSAAPPRSDSSRGTSVPLVPLVTFVFDDGDDTDYLVGKKIFAKQGAVACSAIATDWINTKDHLTPSQIIELRDAGWEIMSHTASHPNLRSLTPEKVEAEFSRSKAVLESLGLTINNIVYPFNKSNAIIGEIASKYYRSGRGGTNSFNTGSIDPYYLKSFTMKHDIPLMKNHIDRAYSDKSWLIFYQHEIDAKVKISDKQGSFAKGETLKLSPSGTVARYVTVHWFPVYGFAMYLVPLSGQPQPGDTITGAFSGATARIDSIVYNELTQLSELISYIHTNYSGMPIVTIDQGLDLLGIPKQQNSTYKKNPGQVKGAL
jgi:peptidoglycan/xylan/chitin deacetylase (PgdA/CDA1 family)